ncbi:MAG: alpha/beta hydrolase, partial [Pseudomonadota bacterium]|nr:alpha/beta hydrolase [Pseudomonadota bacterium]
MDTNLPTLKYRTYTRRQNTEWITFIHGAGGSSTIWHKQIKFFKKDYNLLLIDLRGHGMSNELEIGSNFKYHMIFEEIIEVLDFLKIHKSNFMGVSFGSVIIPHLHQRYPDRVDKMILAGAITGFDARTQFLLNSVHVVKFLLSNILLY